jgi:hypothetical protein
MNRIAFALIGGALFLLLSVLIPEIYTRDKGLNKFKGVEYMIARAAALDLGWADDSLGGMLSFYRWFKITEVKIIHSGRQCPMGPFLCHFPSFKLKARFYTFFGIPVEIIGMEC